MNISHTNTPPQHNILREHLIKSHVRQVLRNKVYKHVPIACYDDLHEADLNVEGIPTHLIVTLKGCLVGFNFFD